jgi:hypothetical protein
MRTPDYPIRTLPFLTDFSTQDRQLAEKAFRQQEERRRKAHESRTQKADEAVEGLRRRLQDLLGAKRLAELRAQITRERLTFADLWQPPEGLDRDYAKAKKASKLKIDALLQKLGASPEKLRPIRSEFRETLEAALLLDDGKVTAGYDLRKTCRNGPACRHCIRFRHPAERPSYQPRRLIHTGGSCSGRRSSDSCSGSITKPVTLTWTGYSF